MLRDLGNSYFSRLFFFLGTHSGEKKQIQFMNSLSTSAVIFALSFKVRVGIFFRACLVLRLQQVGSNLFASDLVLLSVSP